MASLRRRVGWWLLPPLLILLVINAWLSYRGALVAVNLAYDRALTASIRSIGERTYALNGEIAVDIPYSAFEIFEDGAQERVFYAVLGPDGAVVTGYPDLRPVHPESQDGEVVITDGEYRGQKVRVGMLRKRLYDPSIAGGDTITILFAETAESRTVLTRQLFVDSVQRQLLLTAVGVVLVLIALGTAFRPLVALRDRIRARSEEDLTPVPPGDVPSEVRPLIDAINFHMARLSAMLEARRRFLADAAHQIRTPLAVMSTQAEYGGRQDDPEEMRRAFASLVRSIRAARRLANQMLTMSRAEAVNGVMDERATLDLGALAREVALELAPLALAKDVDLAYEGRDGELEVCGNASMLREMIANLIDNAIRYTPSGGHVTVSVGAWGGRVVLDVSDDGPGIPPEEREHVFKRFYRILGHGDSEGSGLGLAIVREICWAHGGEVSLKSGEGGVGLTVQLEFPHAECE